MPTINPHNLRVLRQRKRWSLDELASASKVDRGTINRIERAKQSDNRATTLTKLAAALDTDAETLAGPDLESTNKPWDVEKSQLNFRIGNDARNALSLVADRYAVREGDILHLAPFLFMWAAEESLKQRQQRLNELSHRWNALEEYGCPVHLSGMLSSNWRADEIMEDEQSSIAKRDLFGLRLSDDSLRSGYEESEHNPMAAFLRNLAASVGDLLNFEYWSSYWNGPPGYTIGRELAAEKVGGDEEAIGYIVCGEAPLHEMPKELRDAGPEKIAAWVKQRGEQARHELESLVIDLKL